MTSDDRTTGGAAPAVGSEALEWGARRGGTRRGGARRGGTRRGGTVEGVVALPHDPKAIEDLIAHRRGTLAATIDELVLRAHPKEIARRSVVDVKGRLQAFATTSDGTLRIERLASVAGTAVAFVGLLLLVRNRRGRAR